MFVLLDGTIIDKTIVMKFLHNKLSILGINHDKVKGHSFRIGGATELAYRNAPDYVIQALGRWKGTSYKSYIRMSNESLARHCSEMSSEKVQNVDVVFGFRS